MRYESLLLEYRGDVVLLTLNEPDVLNAIGARMLEELKAAVDMIGDPAGPGRCLLITGAGRGFCSGANLGGGAEGEGAPRHRTLDETYNPLFLKLRRLRMPIVTAVNGPAAGIGMSLALMGDIVLAARSAYFYQAFRNVGLVPDGGATWLLPRLIGRARAAELSLLAQRLPAETALSWGLINRVVEDGALLNQALEVAENLAAGPTVALSLMREAYWQSLDNTYEAQLGLESVLQLRAGATEDAAEGREAFREKRTPHFQGR